MINAALVGVDGFAIEVALDDEQGGGVGWCTILTGAVQCSPVQSGPLFQPTVACIDTALCRAGSLCLYLCLCDLFASHCLSDGEPERNVSLSP